MNKFTSLGNLLELVNIFIIYIINMHMFRMYKVSQANIKHGNSPTYKNRSDFH